MPSKTLTAGVPGVPGTWRQLVAKGNLNGAIPMESQGAEPENHKLPGPQIRHEEFVLPINYLSPSRFFFCKDNPWKIMDNPWFPKQIYKNGRSFHLAHLKSPEFWKKQHVSHGFPRRFHGKNPGTPPCDPRRCHCRLVGAAPGVAQLGVHLRGRLLEIWWDFWDTSHSNGL